MTYFMSRRTRDGGGPPDAPPRLGEDTDGARMQDGAAGWTTSEKGRGERGVVVEISILRTLGLSAFKYLPVPSYSHTAIYSDSDSVMTNGTNKILIIIVALFPDRNLVYATCSAAKEAAAGHQSM